jgi:hypothetical protein
MRYNYKIAMVLLAGVALGGLAVEGVTGVAFADDKLKGHYSVAGTQMCLIAPSRFANDSKGNQTIANGNDSFASAGNFQARITFNGDGTGSVSGTFAAILPPQPDSRAAFKASVGAGTFSYSFTHTPVVNSSFETTITPETYKGTVDSGPRAGQQFTIDSSPHRVFQVSNDQTHGTVAITTPDVEHITYWDPSHVAKGAPMKTTLARICFPSGSLVRLD